MFLPVAIVHLWYLLCMVWVRRYKTMQIKEETQFTLISAEKELNSHNGKAQGGARHSPVSAVETHIHL